MTSKRACCAPRSAVRVKHIYWCCALALGAVVAVPAVAAERVDQGPVRAAIKRTAERLLTGNESAAPRRLPPVPDHEARLELDIVMTTSKIFNPATGEDDTVELRSYRSPGTNPPIPFVAPLIEVQPGETVRIKLNNQLEAQPDCGKVAEDNINIPHCFNSTNLHSHGLWVSPSGNSDNVLITVRPGVSFEYEYNIPADHPAGTFWYHPHLHGSTALQVSSGMAGSLIIHGNRLPTTEDNGDVDTLLAQADGTAMPGRLLQLQQVQYACRDSKQQIKTKTEKDSQGKDVVVAWICDKGDTGRIDNYDQFGSRSWIESNRYTSVNGQVLPTFAGARSGRLERWRLVHAGVRATVALQFKKMKANAPRFDRLRVEDQDKWVKANCVGDALPQWEIASDGLTHRNIIEKTENILQPGYRSDVLMLFPEAGDYCVIDAAAAATATIGQQVETRQVLGKVSVDAGGTVAVKEIRAEVIKQLGALAARNMPDDVKAKVSDDVAKLQLDKFVPHEDITTVEKEPQRVEFDIAGGKFMVSGKAYDPHDARTLVLGRQEEWILTSKLANHPFHIHVNPFQIDKILDPAGVDVSVTGEAAKPAGVDAAGKPTAAVPADTQYANLKGTWRDTLFVKQGYTLHVRSRYERYIGEYVLHCHILDHEDQGMMQNVRMVLPDGKGGGVYGHH